MVKILVNIGWAFEAEKLESKTDMQTEGNMSASRLSIFEVAQMTAKREDSTMIKQAVWKHETLRRNC